MELFVWFLCCLLFGFLWLAVDVLFDSMTTGCLWTNFPAVVMIHGRAYLVCKQQIWLKTSWPSYLSPSQLQTNCCRYTCSKSNSINSIYLTGLPNCHEYWLSRFASNRMKQQMQSLPKNIELIMWEVAKVGLLRSWVRTNNANRKMSNQSMFPSGNHNHFFWRKCH